MFPVFLLNPIIVSSSFICRFCSLFCFKLKMLSKFCRLKLGWLQIKTAYSKRERMTLFREAVFTPNKESSLSSPRKECFFYSKHFRECIFVYVFMYLALSRYDITRCFVCLFWGITCICVNILLLNMLTKSFKLKKIRWYINHECLILCKAIFFL